MLIHLQACGYTGFFAEGAELEILRRALVKQSSNYKQLELLIEKAGSSCVAIGECGLDNDTKNNVKMADQVEVFKLQLKLAIRKQKPLQNHS